ncbi:MAG TPA: hypothetical protein VL754_16380 [Verrucomicrobiae bacterium]|nr:hypothetical protein [Verrucomicrobiae bacterium]
MGYVERNLAGGEKIIHRTKLHPVMFVLPLIFFLVALFCFIAGLWVSAGIFIQSALIIGFVMVLDYMRSECVVTSRCVMGRITRGKQKYPEVPLIDLHAVEFKPGNLSRLFDYGTVVITDRRGAVYEFPGVPGEFYRQIEARLARNQRILK